MSLPVRLNSGAQHDVADIVAWYEAQRPGLGDRFMEALDGLFNQIAENPRQFPVIESEVRHKPETIQGWLRRGTLQGTKIGKEWRVSEADLAARLEQRGHSGGTVR